MSADKLDLITKARVLSHDALNVLVDVAMDPQAPHASRVTAANSIIDRGYGRPKQDVDVGGKDGLPIQFEDVTARDLIASRLALIAARANPVGDTGESE